MKTSGVGRVWCLVLGLASCLGCQGASAPPRPAFVQIRLTDMSLGLVKADGSPWDGSGAFITADDIATLSSALGAPDAAVAVAELLTRPALDGMDKPDVVGKASLVVGKKPPLTLNFKGQPNTLRPSLEPQPTWNRVPLGQDLRIEVTVLDDDLLNDDAVGVFVINAAAISQAVEQGVVHQLEVADQTSNTVLFVGVLVVPQD